MQWSKIYRAAELTVQVVGLGVSAYKVWKSRHVQNLKDKVRSRT